MQDQKVTQSGIQPYYRHSDKERNDLIEQMIESRVRQGSTWDQIARTYNVCVETVGRWRKTDEWRAAENRWRKIMREETRTSIAEVGQVAVEQLMEMLLDKSVSAFTRFNCAKTLLELGGIADEIEETKLDQNDEFLEFLKKTQMRKSVTAKVIDIEALDGGLLPPEIATMQYTPQENLKPEDIVDADYVED